MSSFVSAPTKFKPAPTLNDRVVCAAIRNARGVIICGARHFDNIMRQQILMGEADWYDSEQGFINQRGEWLTREEAWKVANLAKQIIRRVGGDDYKLYSENLY